MKEEDVYLHLDVCKGGFTNNDALALGCLRWKYGISPDCDILELIWSKA